VLPMAIGRHVGVAFRVREDLLLRAHSIAFGETRETTLDSPGSLGERSWFSYVAGMAWMMVESGLDLRGIDCVIDGNVPVGSGLSSSAALEMASARAMCAASGISWTPREMARLGQQTEHRFLGVKCGLMDQLASALAEPGCATLLDCRSMATELVPIPEAARVVVMDTGVRRSLAGSAYNERRASCEAAVDLLKPVDSRIRALRDVTPELLAGVQGELDEVTYRRARHVVEENVRPKAAAEAFRFGDLEEAGRLMNDSHQSLRDLYEVSSVELDLITDLARRHPSCFGARLTGAGFGGCAIALVTADGADTFVSEVHSAYKAEVDLPSELFACRPSAGAHLIQQPDGLRRARPVAIEE